VNGASAMFSMIFKNQDYSNTHNSQSSV